MFYVLKQTEKIWHCVSRCEKAKIEYGAYSLCWIQYGSIIWIFPNQIQDVPTYTTSKAKLNSGSYFINLPAMSTILAYNDSAKFGRIWQNSSLVH